ncbi:MAG TPA: hypothetical protein VG248_00060 [Caulobacteraceae bacterium]|jgi:hypothetical protein|nr:hypothetical protein [Caulobacteraceae bacterium]
MSTEAETAANALDRFANVLASFWTEQPFNVALGNAWNVPALTRLDLVARAQSVAARIRETNESEIATPLRRALAELPQRIASFEATTLPQMPSGNIQICLANLELLYSTVEPLLPLPKTDWQSVDDQKLLPTKLLRRLRSVESTIGSLEPRTDALSSALDEIEAAHTAALELPTDLSSLREAKDEVAASSEAVKAAHAKAEHAEKEASHILSELRSYREEVQKITERAESAFSAATTAGLGGAFAKRANDLNGSIWVWVALLLLSLGSGGVVGWFRLTALERLAVDPHARPEWVWLNAAMSIFSIAAPVWFAWLATRQIGQRFRLAEDYGFKASVARAYEGYRREAARIDEKLEARLFAAALERLEEQPLRFLTMDEHGSPYEALLASPGLQKALETIPTVRDSFLDLARRVLPATGPAPATVKNAFADD